MRACAKHLLLGLALALALGGCTRKEPTREFVGVWDDGLPEGTKPANVFEFLADGTYRHRGEADPSEKGRKQMVSVTGTYMIRGSRVVVSITGGWAAPKTSKGRRSNRAPVKPCTIAYGLDWEDVEGYAWLVPESDKDDAWYLHRRRTN